MSSHSDTSTKRIYTDRSRYQAFQFCPRFRWWAYEFGRDSSSPAGGATPRPVSIPLSTGAHVHLGLGYLLQAARDETFDSVQTVDEAVKLAVDAYQAEVAARGIGIEDPTGDSAYTTAEQSALIEAQIRAFAIQVLPNLLAEYEVVSVEDEKELRLAHQPAELVWQSRADAVLRQRATSDLLVASWKTQKCWDDRSEASAQHDVQGISESVALEESFTLARQELHGQLRANRLLLSNTLLEPMVTPKEIDAYWQVEQDLRQMLAGLPARIEGVLMIFLLKGNREQERDDTGRKAGPYIQKSPLIRGWRRQVTDPVTFEINWEYAWSYYYTCPGPHDFKYAKGGICPGGKNHALSREFGPFNVWEHTDDFRISGKNYGPGIKGWVAALADNTIQGAGPAPGPCLPAQFVTPQAYRRQSHDFEDWRAQATAQEAEVAEHAEQVRLVEDPENKRNLLNRYFPQNKRSCDWPTACSMQPLCFGCTQHAGEIDPLALGPIPFGQTTIEYIPRTPHHEPELAQISEVSE